MVSERGSFVFFEWFVGGFKVVVFNNSCALLAEVFDGLSRWMVKDSRF